MPIEQASHVPDFLHGTAWKEDCTASLTELAIRMGFRAIDTANQRRHYFEAGVGQGLAAAYLTGVVTRTDLFLQTKFTYQRGQDHRLPYDPAAGLAVQVAQSMASSLEHLGTYYVDSYVLHGPSSGYDWTDSDAEVWEAMRKERDAGRTRFLGVSNVSLQHLEQMAGAHTEAPAFVQNRCFARVDGIAMCDRFAGSERLFTGFLASDREHRGFTSSSDHRTCPGCECDSSADCVRVRTRSRDVAADWYFRSRAHEAGPGCPRPDPSGGRGTGD